jgi:acetyl esterase/lipase
LTKSKENVENVVKLPKKPIIIKCLIITVVTPYFIITAENKPMRKDPVIFTANVDEGNISVGSIFVTP